MSTGGSLALTRRTRRGAALLMSALLMLAIVPQAVSALSGAIYSSNFDGTITNANHYATKPDVYLTGGPCQGGSHLDEGWYYFEVSIPNTATLLSTDAIGNRKFHVAANGFIDSTTGTHATHVTGCNVAGSLTIQLIPFNDTTNPGGEYKLTVATAASVEACAGFNAQAVQSICGAAEQKSDNFKVLGPGALKISKTVTGAPAGFHGSFPVSIDCGVAGSFTGTIVFPTPGFITIPAIDAGAVCTVTEGALPTPPTDYAWDAVTYTGNPATIVSGSTVTVVVQNHMHFVERPGFTVDKGVSLSASGPFLPSLNVGTGTLVHYRITITNTGNIPLTGVTLSDSIFNLVTKGCTVPPSLAVGAHYDCNYTDTATSGTKTNIATGDTNQTPPDTGTATVNASDEPIPGFNVEKGVSLSASGPFGASLTVSTGTTVYYRITISNTGNVPLTGVTLADNTFNLAAKGCTVPTTLAVAAHYDCNYSNVATTGTTTNVATGDTDQTGPDSDTATVTASPNPTLTIDKTNNAPLSTLGLPTAAEGATVTFTLTYSQTGPDVSGVTITDVLPAGLTYVTGSATSNGEVSFDGYNAGTRTLTWSSDEDVTESGSVSYQATVNAGAAGLEQPLRNTATIDSDDTAPDSDTSDVFVPVPPQAETNVPTAPRTDALGSTGSSAPGMSLVLFLLALAGVAFAIVMVTPVPASIRNRNRRR
jgi:uncharacterized repeat protein (TIGR01451 family)